MHDQLQQTLHKIIQSDFSLCDDPQRCKGLLFDRLPHPKHFATIEAIVASAEEKLPAKLYRLPNKVLTKKQSQDFAKDFHSKRKISLVLAQWTVEAWVIALELRIVQDSLPTNSLSILQAHRVLLFVFLVLIGLTVGAAIPVVSNLVKTSQIVQSDYVSSQIDFYKPNWESQRFSRGQNILFRRKQNIFFQNNENRSLSLGTKFFREGRYITSAMYFKEAVTANNNDPEQLIYYNNAQARQRPDFFTLAAIVPVTKQEGSAKEILRGVAQAQHQFNERGGLNGQLLEIVIANDDNDPEKASQVAYELTQDPSVLGIIGHNSSKASVAALQVYEAARIPMVSPTSTSTSLESSFFLRTVPSDAVTGKKLGVCTKRNLGISNVVIFFNPDSPYSVSLKKGFETSFVDEEKGNVIRAINLNDPDIDRRKKNSMDELVNKNKIDAIVLFPDPDSTVRAVEIIKATLEKIEGRKPRLLAGDSLYKETVLRDKETSLEGMILVVPWFIESPESQSFAAASYEQWNGAVNWRTAASFDATQAFISALTLKPSASGNTLLEELLKIDIPSDETSGRSLQFTQEGERQGEPLVVEIIRGGVRPSDLDQGFSLFNSCNN